MQTELPASHLAEMQVENASMALELLAKDAHPMQQYRELTENAIQAILATPDRSGQIIWDAEWGRVESNGTYKLACVDTGEGMTGDQQSKLINHLFMSGREQGIEANFGIGAKVTAGAKNPLGLVYLSWRDGDAAMIHFRRRGGPGTPYGLERWEHDGRFYDFIPVDAKFKPPEIDQHGTVVVLLGESEEADTIISPVEGAAPGMKWLSKYLNLRYFAFPDGIDIRVREFPADRARWPRVRPTRAEQESGTRRRLITGMGKWLAENSENLGTVQLETGSFVRWYIRKDDSGSDVYASKGHSAAVFQNELYELLEGNPHRLRMQYFGILYSSKSVCIYVEPAGRTTATVSRSALTVEGHPLSWEEIGQQFRSVMPQALRDLERKIRDAAAEEDYTKSIRERLKAYRDLFKVTAWKDYVQGRERASGESPSGRAAGRGKRDLGESGTPGETLGGRGTARFDYYAAQNEDGAPARRIHPNREIPEVRWISFSAGDYPADRAASYVRTENVIFANSDFRVFQDMMDRVVDQHGVDAQEELDIVRQAVHEWYGQVLVEAVIRSWSFEHEAMWQEKDYESLVSPEALTMAVLPFTFVDGRIRSVVGTRMRT